MHGHDERLENAVCGATVDETANYSTSAQYIADQTAHLRKLADDLHCVDIASDDIPVVFATIGALREAAVTIETLMGSEGE